MRIFYKIICFTFLLGNLFAQKTSFHTQQLSHIPFNESGNDVWGYEKDGIKYAVIGSQRRTSIFSLEDPTNPILRYEAMGASSVWRDMKSYKNHIYVTTDQGQDGLVIIDMSNAPTGITHTNFKPTISLGVAFQDLQRCHNLYIDENGIIYLAGCNISARGVLMFDPNQDPNNPTFLGAADLTYSHDAFARGDTLYASEINIGKITIYDVKDKANPVVIGTQASSFNFTHNAWPSTNGKYVFTTDERANAFVDAYDISQLPEFRLLDRFRPLATEGTGVIPHNTHYYNGYLVTSWYTDGVRIIDANKPDNLIEVAFYDTWNDESLCHNGFHGCWGVFPFTNNGHIYASDIENGLFVIDVDYKRAAYLEGVIKDNNGAVISGATVIIEAEQINRDMSNSQGEYKTGLADAGTYMVRITHPNYETTDLEVELINGEVTILNVEMALKKNFTVVSEIKDLTNTGLNEATIQLTSNSNSYTFKTDLDGLNIREIKEGQYNALIGKWGYKNMDTTLTISEGNNNKITKSLVKGYEDNFELDLGWTVFSEPNVVGPWERVVPKETKLNGVIANPNVDSDDDGNFAYVTTNGIPGASCFDLDNGTTTLTSPEMDLSTYGKPLLNYNAWFYNAGGSNPINDTLIISLSNGIQEVVIDKIFGITGGWKTVSAIDVLSFIPTDVPLRLIVHASDLPNEGGHLVEAGFDHFFVTEGFSSTKDVNNLETVNIYPNPVNNELIIELDTKTNITRTNYQIINSQGQVVAASTFDFHTTKISVDYLPAGLYTIYILGHKPTTFVKM